MLILFAFVKSPLNVTQFLLTLRHTTRLSDCQGNFLGTCDRLFLLYLNCGAALSCETQKIKITTKHYSCHQT